MLVAGSVLTVASPAAADVYGGHGSGMRVYICRKGSGCDANYGWVRNNR